MMCAGFVSAAKSFFLSFEAGFSRHPGIFGEGNPNDDLVLFSTGRVDLLSFPWYMHELPLGQRSLLP